MITEMARNFVILVILAVISFIFLFYILPKTLSAIAKGLLNIVEKHMYKKYGAVWDGKNFTRESKEPDELN